MHHSIRFPIVAPVVAESNEPFRQKQHIVICGERYASDRLYVFKRNVIKSEDVPEGFGSSVLVVNREVKK